MLTLDLFIFGSVGLFIAYQADFGVLTKLLIVIIYLFLGVVFGRQAEGIRKSHGFYIEIIFMALYLSFGSLLVAFIWAINSILLN